MQRKTDAEMHRGREAQREEELHVNTDGLKNRCPKHHDGDESVLIKFCDLTSQQGRRGLRK